MYIITRHILISVPPTDSIISNTFFYFKRGEKIGFDCPRNHDVRHVQEFPGGPVDTGGAGLILGRGTKIPHAAPWGQNNNNDERSTKSRTVTTL